MHPVARLRYLLARRPWLYWLVVVVVAGAIAFAVAGAVGGVDDARRAWGATRGVVVAATALAPGDALVDRVEVRLLPGPILPARALTEVAPDAVARQHVAAGEVLVDVDVTAGHVPVALVPTGWQGVPVAEAVPTGAIVGDRVAATSGGVVLADEAVVVGRNDGSLVVAVPAADAPGVAAAASSGELTILLAP
ncbi:MAG: hypothetical protein H0U21_07375 [Acidimicrobiia bacterium]|nr:hypothetical protein [Acidimicrobiia bacterium]